MAYARSGILNLPADRPRVSRAIAAILGACTTLAFEPVGWWLAVPLLILPLLHISSTVSPRDAGGHFFWYGLGLFLTGTYWIHISVSGFGGAPWWVAMVLMVGLALIMSAWLWLAGWLIARLSHGEPWLFLAVAPAAWVLIEWLRGWVLTGFPWLALGYSQIDTWLAGWAPVSGVYGVSFAVVLSAAAILVAFASRGVSRWIAIGIFALPWIAGAILGAVEWTEMRGGRIQATLIQGGISQDLKWQPRQRQPTLDYYRAATRDVPDSAIVVWPEVAVPALIDQVESYVDVLQAYSRAYDQTIVLGVLERSVDTDEVSIYNSVLSLDGQSRQFYRKRHLVPYGEYFPVPGFVREWMRSMNLPYNDLSKGEVRQPLLRTRDGIELAAAICYEDAYSGEMRYAFPEAGIIINVSNDAWFGDSIAAHQHLQIARMRSLEFGRPTLRATNTGISAFIGHKGEILKKGPQHVPVSLTASIQPRKSATPYAMQGNGPIIVLCLAIFALATFGDALSFGRSRR